MPPHAAPRGTSKTANQDFGALQFAGHVTAIAAVTVALGDPPVGTVNQNVRVTAVVSV